MNFSIKALSFAATVAAVQQGTLFSTCCNNSTVVTDTVVTDTIVQQPTSTIAVIGASGAQGGSVLRALLNEGNFHIRAITRDPSKLEDQYADNEMVTIFKADMDDVETLKKAFAGCYGVFAITNYWQDLNAEHEIQQIKNVETAAAVAKIQHLVLSTLDDTLSLIKESHGFTKVNDKYYVPFFDGKGAASKAVLNSKKVPTTLMYASFYYENFIAFGVGPKKTQDVDTLAITLPMGEAKLCMAAVDDIGKMAAYAFNNYEESVGKELYISSEIMTMNEIAAAFGKAMNKNVVYNNISPEEFAKVAPLPDIHSLTNMFKFYTIFEDYMMETRKMDSVIEKVGSVTSFSKWLEAKADYFLKNI